MTNQTYSAAALAAQLNVPRTTINDWLSRYEDYIDVEMLGKRKVYSRRSLEVLQAVQRLRDEGKSGSEISVFLSQNYGINPEVSVESAAAAAPAEEPVVPPMPEMTGDFTAVENDPDNPQLPALQQFERSAMELTSFIAELREQHQKSVRRSRTVIFLMLVLIVLLLGAAAGLVQAVRMQMAERQYETARMQENMQKMANGFTAELQTQEKARRNERAESARSIKSLQDELIRQQEARAAEAVRLARQIAEDRKAWQKMQEKREKLLSEKSAAEQKILMDKMAEDARKSQAQLDAVKAELAAASKRLQELTGQLNQLNENGGIGGGAIAPSAAGVGPQVPAQNKVAQ